MDATTEREKEVRTERVGSEVSDRDNDQGAEPRGSASRTSELTEEQVTIATVQ